MAGSSAITRCLLAALTAFAVLASPAGAAQEVQELSFEASDGVSLHATVSGEAPLEPRPLIVEFSPYGQGPGGPPVGPVFNYVQVHARGTGRSAGSWNIMGPREQADIKEALRFFCEQPWSSGKIGIYGFSASAIAAYAAMRDSGGLPCVEAAGLGAGTSSLYRDLIFIGGMPNLAPATVVSTAIASAFLVNLPGRFGEGPQAVGDGTGAIGGVIEALNAFLLHTTEDEFWQQRVFPGPGGPPDIPLLAVTGFYDVESRGPFETFQAARGEDSRLLVIGAHDGEAGDSGGLFPELQRFYEHYLLGADNGVDEDPRVRLYVGHGSWQALRAGEWTKVEAANWPVPGTRWRALHLDPTESGSASSANDGSLVLERPAEAARQSGLTVPSNPLATDPYTAATIQNVQQMNLTDAQALTYTSAPLAEPLMAVGPASLEVRLASTSPETDIVAVISDVAPGGAAHPVAAGRLRSAFTGLDVSRSLRDPRSGEIVQPFNDFSVKRPVAPGTPHTYEVEFWPIGNRFEPGHRIRLTLAGTPASFQPSVPAINSIVVGGPDGAALQMPTLPGSDLCAALGGEPCPTRADPTPVCVEPTKTRTLRIGGARTKIRARLTQRGEPVSGETVEVRAPGARDRAVTNRKGVAKLRVSPARAGRMTAEALFCDGRLRLRDG